MIEVGQPSLLVVAYATGVLMFFAPCSVGLLPAYLTYFNTHSKNGTTTPPLASAPRSIQWLTRITGILGVSAFLAGAIPLFYMAVSGLRILLPGYHVIVPLPRFGTGSYDPPVMLVTVGTLLLLQGIVMVTGVSGLYSGLITAFGVTSQKLRLDRSMHTGHRIASTRVLSTRAAKADVIHINELTVTERKQSKTTSSQRTIVRYPEEGYSNVTDSRCYVSGRASASA